MLQARAPHGGVTTELVTDVPGLAPDETSAAEALVRHLTGLNDCGVVAYGAQAGLLPRAGTPAVSSGPRSAAARVGTGGGSTFRVRGSQDHAKRRRMKETDES